MFQKSTEKKERVKPTSDVLMSPAPRKRMASKENNEELKTVRKTEKKGEKKILRCHIKT